MSSVSHLDTHIASSTYPIYLRTVRIEDATDYGRLLALPMGAGEPSKPKEHSRLVEIITKQRESAAKPTIVGEDGRVVSGPPRVNMVLVLKQPSGEKDKIIGVGGYGAIKDWVRDGVNVRAGDGGIVLDPEYRGKGYAAEAMKMDINWAFTSTSHGGPALDIVTVTTADYNTPMIKLVDDKLGLKGRGVRRPGEFDPFEMYYEITKKEWDAIQSP